jgi:hypothetical protein
MLAVAHKLVSATVKRIVFLMLAIAHKLVSATVKKIVTSGDRASSPGP